MKQRILVVEDDLESLKLIGLMLQRRGYEIIAANAGAQALSKIDAAKPDLVILDVMMPGIDGLQVCRTLRANPQTAHLPVIMFSAKSLPGDREAGHQAGADVYLTKPTHPSELVLHVEELLQSSEQKYSGADAPTRARIIGVIGAKGGVGTSTVAVNLAAAAGTLVGRAHEQENSNQVNIIDLQDGLGAVALLLGKMPYRGWAALVGQPARNLSRETVEDQVLTHDSGLRYLPASLQPEAGQPNITADHVNVVINHLASASDYIFLDLGCELNAAKREALSACDDVIVVIEPERLCLYMAQVLLDRIRELDPTPQNLRVVLVVRSRADTALAKEEIEEALGYELACAIEPAPAFAHQAVEQGDPIVRSHPESELAGQFREFVQALLN